ncbi:hypothetical protein Hanom_Chr01g00033761 [Helianthus anomalus]
MLCCYCCCDGQNSASRSLHGLHYHRCSCFQPSGYVFFVHLVALLARKCRSLE